MKLTGIIMFLIPVVVARHNHRTLLETILKSTSKRNMYTKVGNDVQKVMNNLFDLLDLEPDFPSRSRIKLLLTMHYDLKSIAEKNYEVHDKMLEAVETSVDDKTANSISLFDIVEDILDKKPFNISSKLYGKYVPHKRTKHKKVTRHVPRALTTTTETILEDSAPSQPVFADSNEFKEFIQDFKNKIDELSESDFSEPQPDIISQEEHYDDNLEYWEPPPVIEFDFGNETTSSRRIFKGKRSKVKVFPFMASIHLMGTFICAGSILTKDLIITAASCLQLLHNNRFYRENPSALTVRVGSDYFSRGGEIIPIVEAYFHPAYDPKTLANNIVLIRLYKHIRFLRKEKRVKRIRFDRIQANLATNTDGIIVIGWGARKKSNVIDRFERMLVSKLDIYQVNECAEIYSPTFVTNKHFCGGFLAAGGGACNKDVGGPGVVGGTLVGVISFGAPVCGAVDSPTVFTKLGYYAQWIDSVIKTASSIRPIGVRTTKRPPRQKIWPIITHKPKFVWIKPPTTTTEKPTQGFGETNVFALKPKPALHRLVDNDLESLSDNMYDNVVSIDVSDMFATSTKGIKPAEHPLANKSYLPVPWLHTTKQTSKYVTITLTTSATVTMTEETEPTTEATEQTADTKPFYITDLVKESLERETQINSVEGWAPKTTIRTVRPESLLQYYLRYKHNLHSRVSRPHFRVGSDTSQQSDNADDSNDHYLIEPDLMKYQ